MKKGDLFLLLAAFVWGFGLISQQNGMDLMGPWSFTAARCTLGGLSMIPIVIFLDRKKKKEEPEFDWKDDVKSLIKPAIFCGLMIDLCIIFQQYGLLYTTIGKGSFISAFYIFLTPVICLFLRQKVSIRIWISVVIAMVGLYFITMASGFDNLNIGDVIMFGTAVMWAIYIILSDYFVKSINAIKLSCMQFIFLGVIDFIPAAIIEPGELTWETYVGSLPAILYAAIVICAVGYTLQLIGQKTANPNNAALILSSESIFSLLSGYVVLHERLTSNEYLGCAIMAIAIVLASLPEKKKVVDNTPR